MLNYSELQPIDSFRGSFKFKKLIPIDEDNGLYADAATKKKYYVTVISQQHFAIFETLYKKEVFGNIIGIFKKKNNYYCFSLFDGFESLSEFIEEHRGEKELLSELFCLQLIEQIVEVAKKMETSGYCLKILSPFSIILTLGKNNHYRFQLKFPLPHHIFESLTPIVARREIQFCAPQIMIMMDNEEDLTRNKFSKAGLYSLGLVLLYCFGYRIKSEERILALKKSKQFRIFLKAIRKEIKLFQEGKFISKVIKILMEQNEYVRDNIQTFLIKLHSPQLESLRKFIFKPAAESQKQAYIPTVYSDYSDQVRKSGLNRTIEIRLSSMSNNSQNHTQQKSDRSGQQNLAIGDYNYALFATFKRSPETFKCHAEIKEEEQDQKDEEPNLEVPSPIEIHLDWDDEDEQSNNGTPKKELRQSNKVCYDFPEDDLKITIKNCDLQKSKNKEKFLFSEGRSSKNNNEHLKKSSKSTDGGNKMQQLSEVGEIESKSQLKGILGDRSAALQPKNVEKYQIMVEQEPEIIKYSEKEYKIGPSPKLSRKKTSKGGNNDLQDMTLIEEDPDDEEEILEIEQKNETHNEELKMEFSKKSEAIFIILLVNFLIYKIIDYFVQ